MPNISQPINGGNTKTNAIYLGHDSSGNLPTADLAAVESLTGVTFNAVETFANPMPDWTAWEQPWQFTGPNWVSWLQSGPSNQIIFGMDLVPWSETGTTVAPVPNPYLWEAKGAAGQYNTHYAALSQNLKNYGVFANGQPLVVRLGIEANGNWEADWVGDSAQERTAWAQTFANCVTSMRSVPGTSYLFVWNPNAAYAVGTTDLVSWYPGDAYVDIIGLDQYDQDAGNLQTAAAEGWAALAANGSPSTNSIIAFAAQHGKPIAYGEWGLVVAGTDDPAYVNGLAGTVKANPCAFQCYFNSGTAGVIPLDGTNYPQTLAAYKTQFSGAASITVTAGTARGAGAAPPAGPPASGITITRGQKSSLGQVPGGSGTSLQVTWPGSPAAGSTILLFVQSAASSGTTALNSNADFEAGTSPWGANGPATLAQSTAWAQSGTHSAQVTSTGAGFPGMVSEGITVTGGAVYQYSGWLWSPAGVSTGVQFGVHWYNGTGGFISSDYAENTLAASAALQVPATQATAPVSAATAVLFAQVDSAAGAGVVFNADLLKLTASGGGTWTALQPSSVTDNGTTPRTFTLDASSAAGAGCYIYRANNITLPASGAYTVTVTLPSAATAQAGGAEYGGVRPGAPAAASSGGATGTSVAAGSAAPGAPGGLVFGGFSDTSALSPETITFTGAAPQAAQFTALFGATWRPMGIADALTGSAQNLTWTLGDSVAWGAAAAAYAPLTAAGTAAAAGAAAQPSVATSGGGAVTALAGAAAGTGTATRPAGDITGAAAATAAGPEGWPQQILVEAGFTPAGPGLPGTALILGDAARGLLGTGTLGPATAWTPLNGYIGDVPVVQSVTVTRPSTRQQGPLLTYEAGTCTVTLANSDGRFSPENLSGPYTSGGETLVRPMIPLRVRVTWAGVTYSLFSGYVRSWVPPTATLGPDYDYVVAEATDAFCVLEGVTIPASGAVGTGELSGARVSRILAAAGWYAAEQGLSDIDPGISTVQGTTFGGTALELLQLTADSEAGSLYVNGSGQVTFRDRHAFLAGTRSNTVQAVFGDSPGTAHPAGTELAYTEIQKPDDDTTMANDVQASIAGSSNMQRAADAASIARFLFPRSYSRSDLILANDADALSWAQYVLAISKDDESRFDSLTLQADGWPGDLFPQALGREIGDRIQVWRHPPGMPAISKDCFITSIAHTVTVDGWVTEWGLRDATRYGSFLTLDHPVLGQLDSNALAF